MLSFVGKNEYQGFFLADRFVLDGRISIVTGPNGCGKTRFFGAIKNGSIQVHCNDEEIMSYRVQLIEGQSLVVPEEPEFSIDAFAKQAGEAGKNFLGDKKVYTEPWDEMLRQVAGVNMHEYQVPPRQDMYNIVRRVAAKLHVEVGELTAQQVELNFENPSDVLLALPSVSRVINTYLWRVQKNKNDRFRVSEDEVLGYDPIPLDKEEEYFGPPPWKALNKVLSSVFKGKFKFSEPVGKQPNYKAQLLGADGKTPIPVSELSSGEKTLFYLALTIFNLQHRDGVKLITPGLILLDEPDAFLHPSMAMQLFDFLSEIVEQFNTRIMLITHSPSTVALSPSESIIIVRGGGLISVSKDEAIAELLDGVTQISINPHNRRQVYVESFYDAECYTTIYRGVQRYLSDSKVSLTFSAASENKLPKNHVREAFQSTFKGEQLNEELVEQFIKHLNGVGCCTMVEGQVDDLKQQGATTIRGLIDRDKVELKRRSEGYITVLGDGSCYAIENLIFNPVNVMHALHVLDGQKYPLEKFCKSTKAIGVGKWLRNYNLLQKSVNWFVSDLIGCQEDLQVLLEFSGGAVVRLPGEYLNRQGHQLARLIVEKHPVLAEKFGRKDSKVMTGLASFMVDQGGDFVPKLFLDAFSRLRL